MFAAAMNQARKTALELRIFGARRMGPLRAAGDHQVPIEIDEVDQVEQPLIDDSMSMDIDEWVRDDVSIVSHILLDEDWVMEEVATPVNFGLLVLPTTTTYSSFELYGDGYTFHFIALQLAATQRLTTPYAESLKQTPLPRAEPIAHPVSPTPSSFMTGFEPVMIPSHRFIPFAERFCNYPINNNINNNNNNNNNNINNNNNNNNNNHVYQTPARPSLPLHISPSRTLDTVSSDDTLVSIQAIGGEKASVYSILDGAFPGLLNPDPIAPYIKTSAAYVLPPPPAQVLFSIGAGEVKKVVKVRTTDADRRESNYRAKDTKEKRAKEDYYRFGSAKDKVPAVVGNQNSAEEEAVNGPD